MVDLNRNERALPVEIFDESTGLSPRVETIDGKPKMLTDTSISSVNVPLGKDPLPDMYGVVTVAGSIGDTVILTVKATAKDSTAPDRDIALFTDTYTLIAEDAGDEQKLCDNLANFYNGLAAFTDDALLEATSIDEGEDVGGRAVFHVSSTKFSLNGEFFERPNPNDVLITTTGTTVITQDTAHTSLVSRAKEVSLARDPDNKHRLGVQSVSGTVKSIADSIEKIYKEFALDGAVKDMAVDGSTTPLVYSINADVLGGETKIIEVFKFYGNDGNIKVNGGRFLGTGFTLTNGILVEITKNGVTREFENIKSTVDMLAAFSTGPADEDVTGQSGGDFFYSVFDLVSRNIQIELKAGSTDKIVVTIRDDISSVDSMFFRVEGFIK